MPLYDPQAPKRPANPTLNSDLATRSREAGPNRSAPAEQAAAASLARRARENLQAEVAQACRVHDHDLAEYGSLGEAVRTAQDAAGSSAPPRHRAAPRARFPRPYLLVLQHHDIPASTRLAAPVTLPLPGDVDVLAPSLAIEGTTYRARLLDIGAVSRALLAETVASARDEADAITAALDIILHGNPVALPL